MFTATQRERHTAKGITVDMPNRKGNTKRVTLTDVARESGVAPSTVSIVLNEAPLSKNIADRTKEQIRSTAKRLGYRPDAFARSLRSRRSNAVGIMVFDLSDPFCSQILRGIEHALQSTGYLPIAMNANNDRGQLGGYFDPPRSRMTTLPRPDGCRCSTTI